MMETRPCGPALLRLVTAPLLLWCATAAAQTDEIQVYDASIVDKGMFNLTLHNNYTVHGSTEPSFPDGLAPDHRLNGVAEWAYGMTDWFEAGLYLPIYSAASGDAGFQGFKIRTLFVVPHADDRRFRTGELSQSVTGSRRSNRSPNIAIPSFATRRCSSYTERQDAHSAR